ncbi:MAG: DNA-directed RNA polymerase subunit P [Candidatus Bathyarchaeia archaeon]
MSEGIVYECLKCRANVTSEQLSMIPEVKCPYCGYRVLKKVRPPIVKNVKAK